MYTVWWVSNDFSERLILTKWTRLTYWERLNDSQPLEVLAFAPNAMEGVSLPDYARIQIHNGERLVWSGRLCGETWGLDGRGYRDVEFQGMDATHYAARALVIPQQSYATVEDGTYVWPLVGDRLIQTGCVDDQMRSLVRSQLVAPLHDQREHSDIRCEDDLSIGTSLRTDVGTDSLLQALQDLAERDNLRFRFVPQADGATFMVRRLWGQDRTGTYIVEQTRHNLEKLTVRRFYGTVENAVYGIADGGGVFAPQVVPAFNETSIAGYGIGEVLLTQTGTPGNIYTATEMKAAQARVTSDLTLGLLADTYGSKWYLGDTFTIRASRGERLFTWEVMVTGVRVIVDATGRVTAEPELEVQYA